MLAHRIIASSPTVKCYPTPSVAFAVVFGIDRLLAAQVGEVLHDRMRFPKMESAVVQQRDLAVRIELEIGLGSMFAVEKVHDDEVELRIQEDRSQKGAAGIGGGWIVVETHCPSQDAQPRLDTLTARGATGSSVSCYRPRSATSAEQAPQSESCSNISERGASAWPSAPRDARPFPAPP